MLTVCLGQSDTTKKLSIKQVDSLIRFSESVKTLRERFDLSIKEASTFKSLWQSEKESREKDKADYKLMIDGYSAIEASNGAQIRLLTRKYKSAVRLGRFYLVIAGAAVGFAAYTLVK